MLALITVSLGKLGMIALLCGMQRRKKARPLHLMLDFLLISGRSDQPARDVIVKAAPTHRIENEVKTLRFLQGHPFIRQVVDEIDDSFKIEHQSIVVLEHLTDNIQHVVNLQPKRRLKAREVKATAKAVLKGLEWMHSKGFAHTGMLFYIRLLSEPPVNKSLT